MFRGYGKGWGGDSFVSPSTFQIGVLSCDLCHQVYDTLFMGAREGSLVQSLLPMTSSVNELCRLCNTYIHSIKYHKARGTTTCFQSWELFKYVFKCICVFINVF